MRSPSAHAYAANVTLLAHLQLRKRAGADYVQRYQHFGWGGYEATTTTHQRIGYCVRKQPIIIITYIDLALRHFLYNVDVDASHFFTDVV